MTPRSSGCSARSSASPAASQQVCSPLQFPLVRGACAHRCSGYPAVAGACGQRAVSLASSQWDRPCLPPVTRSTPGTSKLLHRAGKHRVCGERCCMSAHLGMAAVCLSPPVKLPHPERGVSAAHCKSTVTPGSAYGCRSLGADGGQPGAHAAEAAALRRGARGL